MAVDFPSNPTNGQTITVSGITYAYDSTQGVWSDSPQGLTQAIDALTDVDTSTVAPTNGQVLQWNSTDSEWQPADSSAGVTVYATIDDLPLSGVAEGSMALVDSTDKLYIFSDAGWYSITLVNTTPSISGVNATYTLATDGTATVVTVTATDPEGLPLTYSIVSDTSGNIATVTQGTGANTNQWTITPSTNSANAGNFTLVFRASDGVNVASASSTFELQFSVVNSNYTTALITTADNGFTSNKLFRDSSGNNHTITANGDATQSTFSPYRHGGYSTYFDGTGDYLGVPDDSGFDFDGDFCVELWLYREGDTSGTYQSIIGGNGNGVNGWTIYIENSSNALKFFFSSFLLSGGTVIDNQWNHVAVTRSGTSLQMFLNGSVVDSATNSTTFTDSSGGGGTRIGYDFNGNGYYQGYIADIRIVKGAAVYTSAFTPTTERLTAITNTSLLTCHLPYIADGSTNSHAITVNGNTKTEPFGPYDYQTYSASNNGGSAYFDGTGDYLNAGTDSSLALGSGDFTFECWIYPPTATMANYAAIYSNTSEGQGDSNALRFGNLGTSSTTLAVQTAASSIFNSTSGAVKVGQWNHVALVRNGTATNNMTIYVNGVASGQGTSTANFSTGYATIGTNVYAGVHYLYSGYIADVRVVQGTAVYTSAFTPPTAPLTAISGTGLLLPFDDAGIIDKSQSVKTITLNGDVKSSTTQSKYLTSSMYFDGTGDYVQTPTSNLLTFGSEDFTVEGWFYTTSTGAYQYIFDGRNGGTDVTYLYLNNGTGLYAGYGNVNDSSVTTLSLNQWYHFAYVRNGSGTNNITVYIDGTAEWQITNTTNLSSTTRITLGSRYTGADYFGGYMSDVRITKGLARYTANFTPPSAALGG